jgi:uncharacterized protein YvpB
MADKLIDAAKFYKGFKEQIDAFNWLEATIPADKLKEFFIKYRANASAQDTYTNDWDGVIAAAKVSGAKYPELVAAQWALESNWGKHVSGKNNYFGLKGTGTNQSTQEFINGNWITITDGFLDFPSLLTCVSYLVDRWYKDYKEYKGVNNATNRNTAAKQLKEQNYATDPEYPTKLIQIMDQKSEVPGGNIPKLNPLPVLYMSQRDNYRDANRTCFSSSCAMMLKYLKPKAITNDDDYIKTVFSYGDSTDSMAQIKALFKYGIEARFNTKGTPEIIKKQIDNNKPVPVGFLHHGHVTSPSGGGHWLCIIGYNDTGYIVNDPWGDMDLINGEYLSSHGAKLNYSYRNFNPRWLVEGPYSGWCILV